MLMIFSMFMSFCMIFLQHPLSLGMILLSQTLLTSLIINMINYNFWYSYILFLIMIGGMLILFIYMTSIASNEKFKISNLLIFMFTFMIMMIIMLMIMDNLYFNINSINFEMIPYNKNMNPNLSLNKYFNFPSYMIFYLSIIYLLITLIAVVKISNFNLGPLRQNN
uniref:NADH-ubiquinone oxidoreductase chain 6 n=1 Tax=Melyridae sp. 'Dasytidae' GENSP01 TaxID=1205814 RepID=A0A0S2MPD5_9CUCU|nr:NADH deshydrogenase subunit 6 [Melyridae sp. 'Dasytidae' GENSP01]